MEVPPRLFHPHLPLLRPHPRPPPTTQKDLGHLHGTGCTFVDELAHVAVDVEVVGPVYLRQLASREPVEQLHREGVAVERGHFFEGTHLFDAGDPSHVEEQQAGPRQFKLHSISILMRTGPSEVRDLGLYLLTIRHENEDTLPNTSQKTAHPSR